MKIFLKLTCILFCMTLIESCGVATKNRKHTTVLLKCQDKELVDVRTKYTRREKQLERKTARKLRRIDKVR